MVLVVVGFVIIFISAAVIPKIALNFKEKKGANKSSLVKKNKNSPPFLGNDLNQKGGFLQNLPQIHFFSITFLISTKPLYTHELVSNWTIDLSNTKQHYPNQHDYPCNVIRNPLNQKP